MLLLNTLAGGGAERVAAHLLNHCDPAVVDIRLGLLDRAGPLLDEVDTDRVLSPRPRGALPPPLMFGPADFARMIRIAEPEVLMSFGMGVDMLAWLALKTVGRKAPYWIGRHDSNPVAELDNLRAGGLGRAAVKLALGRTRRSMGSSVAVSADLAAAVNAGAGQDATRVIYNPIDIARIQRLATDDPVVSAPRPYIVTAGRLVRQKGHDLLIKAFAETGAARDMDLIILGEGPLRGSLMAQAAALDLADRVRLVGFQANPWAWIARSTLFVLPSRWEGFGNVVAEALACGAPTLVTDCDYGPREQVAHGISGWVVPTESAFALAAAMDHLISQPALRARLARNGLIRARDFNVAKIAAAYTELFLSAARAPR